MARILYTGLHHATLRLLKSSLQGQENTFTEVDEKAVRSILGAPNKYQALLVGEQAQNPVRVAQEAYSQDKYLSVLLINDEENFQKVKQSLQFSPFIGPTISCVSNQVRERLPQVIQDAVLRTEQRRSFQHMRQTSLPTLGIHTSALDKIRGGYTAKVLEEAPIGAMLVERHGHVLTANAYATQIFEKTERDILSASFASLFPQGTQPAISDFLNQHPIQHRKKVVELGVKQQVKYLELSVAEVDEQNSEGFRILIINDITATVLAQQHTEKHLQELEEANQNLKRLNADLDTFVYTASHDLKSPILNIEGLVELLEDVLGDKKTEVAEEISHMKAAVQRFKNTVEDLTEVARIQKNFEQEPALLQVAEVVEEVKGLISAQLKATQAVVSLDCSAAPTVHMARHNFKSIIYNLLSNAVKYSAPGRQPVIRIKTWQQADNFYLQVQDNGLGIPQNKREKVFELFKRIHVHVSGTGIGLYIVKRIVQNNGGSISLESTENEGSTFTVKLKV